MEIIPGPGLPDRWHHLRVAMAFVKVTRQAAVRSSCELGRHVEENKNKSRIIIQEFRSSSSRSCDREDRRASADWQDQRYLDIRDESDLKEPVRWWLSSRGRRSACRAQPVVSVLADSRYVFDHLPRAGRWQAA